MRVDWYVLSVIHFSLVDRVVSEEDSSSCRNLNFFTVGITDLYQSNDDVRNIDDCSENDSEHFGVSDIADEVEIAHGKNFSRALYLALRHKESLPVTSIHNEDVAYALKFCSFKEVLQAYVSLDDLSDQLGSEAEKMAGRKLSELIGCLLW